MGQIIVLNPFQRGRDEVAAAASPPVATGGDAATIAGRIEDQAFAAGQEAVAFGGSAKMQKGVDVRFGTIFGHKYTPITPGTFMVIGTAPPYLFKSVGTSTGVTGATEPTWDTSEYGALTVDGEVTWEYRPLVEMILPATVNIPEGVSGATGCFIYFDTITELGEAFFKVTLTLNDNTEISGYGTEPPLNDPQKLPAATTVMEGGKLFVSFASQGQSVDKLIKSVTITYDESLPMFTESDYMIANIWFSTVGGTPSGGGFRNG